MPEKIKIVITHNTFSHFFENSEKEMKLFDKLDLFAPEQMKLRIKKDLSYYSKEKTEKLEKLLKKLYKSITFISFTLKKNEKNIYKIYYEVLKKVQAKWIWDGYKYRKNGSHPIPYIDSDGILEALEEEKEGKVFSTSSSGKYSTLPALPIEWLTPEAWAKKQFENLDVFQFVNNYLHHVGLLCLSDGQRYYLNEEASPLSNSSRFVPEEKLPTLPPLVKEEKMEIWYMRHPCGEERYREIIVEKKKRIPEKYWECFLGYDAKKNDYFIPSEGVEAKRLCIDSKKETSSDIGEDEQYEFIPLAQVLDRCHIPNEDNKHHCSYYEGYKEFFDTYQKILQEIGEIIIIGSKTFLTSGLHRLLYCLIDTFEHYEERVERYNKYEAIKLVEIPHPPLEFCSEAEWLEHKNDSYLDAFKFTNSFLHYEGLLCLTNGERYYLDPLDKNKNKLPDLKGTTNLLIASIELERQEYYANGYTTEYKKKSSILDYWEFFIDVDASAPQSTPTNPVFKRKGDNFNSDHFHFNPNGEAEEDYDEFLSFQDCLERYKIGGKYQGDKTFHDVFRERSTIIVVGEISFLATGLKTNQCYYSFQQDNWKFEDFEQDNGKFEDFEAEVRRKYDINENEHVMISICDRKFPDTRTTLNLSYRGIKNLPAAIGQFKNLKELNLWCSDLGTLPPEIGQLKNLEVLDLSFNKLSTLPSEIGQLKNLKRLYLSHNELETLPSEIGQLKNLEELDLSYNELETLPPEIGQLKNLKRLNLKYDQLSNISSELEDFLKKFR